MRLAFSLARLGISFSKSSTALRIRFISSRVKGIVGRSVTLGRRAAAARAREFGEDPHPYWHEQAQLNTVGYLTTIAGAMVAGYAIGWLTGGFEPPFDRVQLNLAGKLLDVTDPEDVPRTD
jgi:hypothetical protein